MRSMGKLVSGSLEQLISSEKQGPFHIHDIGHMVKSAEVSLQGGTHFDGRHSYGSNDLVVVISSVPDHKSVQQYDKQE